MTRRLPRPMWLLLATIALLVAVVGVRVLMPIYREQAALRQIERVGGTVRTLPRYPAGPPAPTNADQWQFSNFVEVALNDSRVTDDTLAYLGWLPKLESLLLDNTSVSDSGLSHLKGLTGLQNLRLDSTRVTDAGLSHLAGLKNLQVLSLDHTQVTDAGLDHLRRLTRLIILRLSDTKATHNGIAALRQALPETEVVVDPALATPPDPVPPESDIVRYRFRHCSARRQTTTGFQELPETDFGELLFERTTGRCVYRYWYDGVHERPDPWKEPAGPPDDNPNPREHVGAPLKGAAAFDGKRYWTASYNIPPRRHADRVAIYGRGGLGKRDGVHRHWPSWHDWAPLHHLAAAVGCDSIEREKIHRAIQAFSQTQRYGPHAASLKSGAWNYVVSLDQSALGVRRVDVQLAGGWSGHWPFPVPMRYSMERENANDIDSERLHALTNVEEYIDESTDLVE